MLWLYLGPEVIAPIASALAALGGVLLMFWRRVSAFFRSIGRLFSGKTKSSDEQIGGPPADKGKPTTVK